MPRCGAKSWKRCRATFGGRSCGVGWCGIGGGIFPFFFFFLFPFLAGFFVTIQHNLFSARHCEQSNPPPSRPLAWPNYISLVPSPLLAICLNRPRDSSSTTRLPTRTVDRSSAVWSCTAQLLVSLRPRPEARSHATGPQRLLADTRLPSRLNSCARQKPIMDARSPA